MTSQTAYDRYNDRYNNDAYLAAVEGMSLTEAVLLQNTALRLCENPDSPFACWIAQNAKGDAVTTFLALFV